MCWKCTKSGHSGRECPDVTCYVCNKKGHMAYACPDRKTDGKGDGKKKCVVHGANASHNTEECETLKAFIAKSNAEPATTGPGKE